MAAGRKALGGLGLAFKQTRPDLCAHTSLLLTDLAARRRDTLRGINTAIHRAKTSRARLTFPAGLGIENAIVLGFSDASWANRRDGGSQGAQMYTLASPCIRKDQEGYLAPLQFSSGRVKRVCRSTLTAVTLSACACVEGCDYVKVLLGELRDPNPR